MKNFLSDKNGAVMLIFGLTAIILAIAVFASIQLTSTSQNVGNLQQAADNAALAGARTMFRNLETQNTAVVQKRVQDFIAMNFPQDATNTGVEVLSSTVDWNTLQVDVTVKSTAVANSNAARPAAGAISARATAELIFPESDWCMGVDLSSRINSDYTNSSFSRGASGSSNSGEIVREVVTWINQLNANNTYKKKLAYAIVPYGNSVNVGVYNMDGLLAPLSSGKSHLDAVKSKEYIDKKFTDFSASCSGCTALQTCNSDCSRAPACDSGSAGNCWQQFLDLYIRGIIPNAPGISVGCVLARKDKQNYFTDATALEEKFDPMITFFETGCSSGHMFCLPPVLPLTYPGDALYGQMPNMGSVPMWDVDTSSVGGSAIQFDQKPLFIEGLSWCNRMISPKWDKTLVGYSQLPDYTTWSGKGVKPNYGQPSNLINIDDKRKKIITLFAAGFVDQVNPNKVQVALSLVDATAYSEHPKADEIATITKEACDYIKTIRYNNQAISVFVVNTNPNLKPAQVDILKGCATTPDFYQEVFKPTVSTNDFKEIMLEQLDRVVYTRLISSPN
ncbi:MAG: hypothetical protein LW855_03950 [Alphaproteobacteria bacterium]|nr:hypothetical protein [Alphaproteobacteria bacterium]